ncbi:sensor histidine kinase [Anaerosporobacter faecicola]|uniref:sensor histidine kinase n=1 Tax=Anaerosporobacter faecicola TaxID=2718714 RepID=UPI00143AB259|nr:HAMP domain-containing sensor histidine kinase [Anaerosporobacter faecicola]
MKFWQKVFISVLLLFVVTFNVGMFIVMHYTYQEQLNSVKQRARAEAYFLRNSISNDFTNLEATSILSKDKKQNIYRSYASYYEKQNVYLELWSGTSRIGGYFDKERDKREELNTEDNMQNLVIRKENGTSLLILACNLKEPYENHILVTAYPLTEVMNSRRQLVQIIIGVDVVLTVVLGGMLYLILHKLMKPLRQLTVATEEIGKGKWEKRITITTKDEFGDLARKFNGMSDKIEETIGLLQEESDKKQQLIDNLAHEMRTPLTSISGYADYIRMASLSEEEKIHALNYIIAESKRLEKLSRTLLMIVDIREGTLVKEEVSTSQLKQYICDLFSNILNEKEIELHVECDIENFLGSEALLQILVGNLIENAIRACEQGGRIQITFGKKEQEYIQIVDNGVGMKPEELKKIQEPFYRIDKARSRKNGGVGLGVTLCNQIVKLHGGELQYDSVYGQGTTVWVYWN